MSLVWNELYISVLNTNKNIKTKHLDLIKNSSGSVKPGEVLVIMGPSGGGKSTLLNALAGRIPSGSLTQGSILYNNKKRLINNWCNEIGFVEQDVLLKEELSVKETLKYVCEFGIGSVYTQPEIPQEESKNVEINELVEQIDELGEKDIRFNLDNPDSNRSIFKKSKEINSTNAVQKVINDLNLHNVADNTIGKLSGGERKRASIGTAIMKDPSILFLDEPTSGLDTLTALKICRILKRMAVKRNKAIILTIHQPSNEIFYMFDKILLLSEGNVIYYGAINTVEKYLSEKGLVRRPQVTVPEFIVEICSEDFKKENQELFYNETSIFKDNIIVKNKDLLKSKNDLYINFKPSLRHTYLLFKRRLAILRNNKFDFLKTQFFKLFVNVLLVFLSFQLKNSMTQNSSMQGIQMQQLKELLDDSDVVQIIQMLMISMFILFQVSYAISCYFDESKLVKAEISNGYYSISSYYIATLIFQVLHELIAPFLSFLLYMYLLNTTDIYSCIVFIVTPFITIPFGLFIGSFTVSKQIIPIMSTIFGTLSSIPPELISLFNKKYGHDSDGKKNILCYLSLMATMITPLYYTASLKYGMISSRLTELYKDSNSKMNKLKIYINENNQQDQLLFINYIRISPLILAMLVPFSTIMSILFGIFFAGINNRPNMRMQMENNKVNKRI